MSIKGKNLANDLLNLEINTIMVEGISSRKMPDQKVVLKEIAEKYQSFLKRTAGRTEAAWDESASTNESQSNIRNLKGRIGNLGQDVEGLKPAADRKVFEGLENMACTLIKIREDAHDEGLTFDREIGNVLRRIHRNCQSLCDLSGSDLTIDLTPKELLRVRKVWEIGTERVVMQTVVQLDGDIVNRIQIGRETEKDKILHDMHKDLVNLAIGNWQFMVKTLVNLVQSAIGNIFRLK